MTFIYSCVLFTLQEQKKMEESAFEHIAPELRRKAIVASQSCGVDSADAEDIAQDVMLKLWSMRNQLDKYNSVEALVILMAKRLTYNLLRNNKNTAINQKTYLLSSNSTGPHETLEEKEDTAWLEQQMNKLPTTQHTILYMRQVERRSHQEIARLLAISEASVSTLLARARKALLEEMRKR